MSVPATPFDRMGRLEKEVLRLHYVVFGQSIALVIVALATLKQALT